MGQFENTYFALRHGESKANIAQIIISTLQNGIKEDYTLTEKGGQQVFDSVTEAKSLGQLNEDVIIYSSPFSRCIKTAQIAKEVLDVKDQIHIDERLSERNFGDLEKTRNSNYQKIWDEDALDLYHKNYNVESVFEVKERALSLINELESNYQDKIFLIVSHGDTLQILQAVFSSKPPSEHRSLNHLKTGEIRKLNT